MAGFKASAGTLALAVAILLPRPSHGAVVDIEILPPNPSSTQAVSVKLSGTFTDTCVPENATSMIVGGDITIATTNDDAICDPVDTPYSLPPVDLGMLAAGLYCVTVTYESTSTPVTPIGDEKCFTVADFTKFEGRAGQVGKVQRPGQVGGASVIVSGEFSIGSSPALDLSTSTVEVTSVLVEGTDELVKGTDLQDIDLLTLTPNSGATSDKAVFWSPQSRRPSARLVIRERAGEIFDFQLRISRAIIPQTADACAAGSPTVELKTGFTITDSVSGSTVEIVRTASWLCRRGELRTVRSGSGGGGGGSGNRCPEEDPSPAVGSRPVASLRTNLITRNAGVANWVELNGASSSDKDGDIVEYTFRVYDRGACTLAFGPVTTAQPTLAVLLDPGEYVGSLTVKDDAGNSSKPNQRGFSTP